MTTTENVDSQKWYKFLLDKNEMKVIINLLGQGSLGRPKTKTFFLTRSVYRPFLRPEPKVQKFHPSKNSRLSAKLKKKYSIKSVDFCDKILSWQKVKIRTHHPPFTGMTKKLLHGLVESVIRNIRPGLVPVVPFQARRG